MSEPVDIDAHFVVDSPASERFPVYTRANVAEIFPGPVTPLGYTTLAGELFNDAWRRALVRFGAFDVDELDVANRVLLGVFYGYPYLNVSVQRVFGYRMPGATPDAIDASFFGGGSADVPPYEHDPRDASPKHTDKIGATIEWAMRVAAMPELDEMLSRTEKLRADRPDFTTLSDSELFDYAEPLITTMFADINAHHMFVTSVGAMPIGALEGIAAELDEPGLVNRVMCALGGVVSAAPAWSLWELSRLVRESAALTAIFDEGIQGLWDRLEASRDDAASAFRSAYREFLYRHGSRGTNEMDLAASTWETNPSMPLTAIDRMRLQPEAAAPQHNFDRLRSERTELVAKTAARLPAEKRDMFSAALRAAEVFLPAREKTKLASVVVLHEGRMALRELGRRMTANGIFERVEDFALLCRSEFRDFLTDPGAFAGTVRHRRRWLDELSSLEPPFITVGVPPPPSTWPRRSVVRVEPASAGECIEAIAACPGVATGRARVVRDPYDCADLEPGDVLVAPSTDPSWTPLFLAASAVVVDVGAPLSHAAIVSRELGIPCIVSALHASRRIRNGAIITVDGTRGSVTVVSP